jgi:hypothetical protein
MDYELWPNKSRFIYHRDKKIELGELWKIASLDISQRGYYITKAQLSNGVKGCDVSQ